MTRVEKDGWIEDENGNRCSIDYFGSHQAALDAINGLKWCDKCVNCSDCSRCSYCSYCSDCSDCSYCSDCSRCSYCSYCSDCSDCSDCSYCSYCSDCSDCSRCSYCSYCSDCSDFAAAKQPTLPIPVIPEIDKRVYEAVSHPGALDMQAWHTCETTHCRAGWVVHLAGDAGRALESRHNTELAAMLIYRESGSPINPSKFYDSNEDAMADIKRRAGVS